MAVALPHPSLELCLLGHARVLVNEVEVNFATRKALGLLAFLALEGTTTRSKLADVFWSDIDEDAARNNLRKEVFRLRETPLREFLEVSASTLSLSKTMLDVQTFLESQDDAALELYKGDFLAGIEISGAPNFEDWLEEKRELFRTRFAQLLTARALKLEVAGDLRTALETRLKLLETDPLQESFHREVMRLHWRLGERTAALARFATLQQTLEHELGLKPLPETLALLQNIENSTVTALELDSHTTTRTPALHRPPFIGRDIEWAWLETRNQGLALVKGEAGVGKTRLIEDLAKMLGQPIILRGFESATGTPFYPVAETLRTLLETKRLNLENLEPVWKREVARLVPEFETQSTNTTTDLPSSEGRARFIEGLSRVLLAALQPADTLIFDDLHWFDASSLELIAHLVRRAPSQTRMIANARALEFSENAQAKTVLTALERDGLLEQLELQPFDISETLSLVQSLSGGRAKLFSTRLHEATGGNALFTLETLRGLFENNLLKLEEDGTWTTPFDDATKDYTELPIPPNVRDLVLTRLERLGAASTRLLEAASIAFEPFEADWLEGATALSEWENLESLEHAINAAVLIPEGAGYRFGHDLTRRALKSTLSVERTRLIHRKLAHNLALENKNPAHVAAHLEGGDRTKDAIPWRIKAAQAAQAVFAHIEARAHYQRALELQPETQTAFKIHKSLSELELTLMNLDGLETHTKTMLELSTHDTNLEIEARLMLARHGIYRGQYTEALEQAEHAHELTGTTGKYAAESLLLGGTALVGCGRLTDAETRLLNGLKLEHQGEMYAELHSVLKEVYRQQGSLPEALKHARASYTAYQKISKIDSEITMLAQIGQMLGAMGQPEEALEMLEKAVKQAREMGFERVLTFGLALQAEELIQTGYFENAEHVVLEGLELSRGRILARECQFTNMFARIKRRTGRFGEALQLAKRALELSDELGLPIQKALQHLFISDAYLDLGALKNAQKHLDKTASIVQESGLSAFNLLFTTLQARCHLIEGEAQLALNQLEKVRNQLTHSSVEHRAIFFTTLAQAVLQVGDFSGALTSLKDSNGKGALEARAVRISIEATLAISESNNTLDQQLLTAESLLKTNRIPSLEAFELYSALKIAYETIGKKNLARVAQQKLEPYWDEMVKSLDSEPELQQSFLERYNKI